MDPKTALVYHPDYLLHDTGYGHPESPDRLRAIMSHLEATGLAGTLQRLDPAPASDEWILRVHAEGYLADLAAAEREAPVYLDPDTPLSADSLRVARLAVGGLLAAVDAVLAGRARNAFAALRPPGHHAMARRAMGFCIFNNVAIAARYAQACYGVERVLIADWDVHHGNGTQAAFYRDPSVFYFSTHQYPYYPGTGAADETGEGPGRGTTLNVPLRAGAGDAEILQAFRGALMSAAEAFRPELVLVSAGFDAHERDPLAALRVTTPTYAELTRVVMEIADRHSAGRVISTLEGGYDLQALSESVAAHLRALTGA